MRVSRLCAVFGAALLSCISVPTEAWWDHGHMLVGAIARQELGPEATGQLEAVLQQFDIHYPGFGRLDSGATWADHIQCVPDKRNPQAPLPPYCLGMDRLEGLGVFYENHFVSFIYNPHSVPLRPEYATHPRPTGNAPWLLEQAVRGLTLKDAGTVFSWNIFLRLLLHMMGDLHQPLHSQSAVSVWFNGTEDMGGNKVWMRSDIPNVDNLHKLWDSAAGLYPKNFPTQIDLDQLQDQAKELIRTHPRSSFGGRLSVLQPWDIAKESRTIAKEFVYKELVSGMNTERDFKSEPYVASPEYIADMQPLCTQQIVLGGYRLADILRQTLPFLPPIPGSGNSNGKKSSFQAVMVTDGEHVSKKRDMHKAAHTHGSELLALLIGLALAVSLFGNFLLSKRLLETKNTHTISNGVSVSPAAAHSQSEGLMAGQDSI